MVFIHLNDHDKETVLMAFAQAHTDRQLLLCVCPVFWPFAELPSSLIPRRAVTASRLPASLSAAPPFCGARHEHRSCFALRIGTVAGTDSCPKHWHASLYEALQSPCQICAFIISCNCIHTCCLPLLTMTQPDHERCLRCTHKPNTPTPRLLWFQMYEGTLHGTALHALAWHL
jgi:hypothetical protein